MRNGKGGSRKPYVDQKLQETVFFNANCCREVNNILRRKTQFLAFFDPLLSVVKSIFDSRLSIVNIVFKVLMQKKNVLFPETFEYFFVPHLFEEKQRDIVFGFPSVFPSFRPPKVLCTLCAQLLLQFYADSFETFQMFLSWSEDMHVV